MNRKAEMIKMRESGATYKDIGEAFGISRQAVFQHIGGMVRGGYFKTLSANDCIYPNLRKWMNDNHMSRSKLCRAMFGNTLPSNQHHISNFLRGKNSGATKHTIDKYLTVTGLTYEELFETDKE